MANIKKGARAYYADTDYRRDGMNEAYSKIDSMPSIPTPEDTDAGKVIKVNDSGVYALSDDLHTPVVANPEGTPAADLNSITIGDTIYKVNDARVNKILALRFTIDNGGTYNANLPQISIVNEHDEAAVLPTNTMTCDKPVQYGALTPTGTPGVLVENLPAEITLTFAAEFNIEDYPNIKLTKGALFPQDIAKNIKIEYSLNSEDWAEIADLVSIDWTGDYHIYDMSTGEETTTTPAIPTPTTADAGKVLGVDNNGAWNLNSRNIVVDEAIWINNQYELSKNQTCTELINKCASLLNQGIIPFLKIDIDFLPLIKSSSTRVVFSAINNVYESNLYVKYVNITQSNDKIVNRQLLLVSFTT